MLIKRMGMRDSTYQQMANLMSLVGCRNIIQFEIATAFMAAIPRKRRANPTRCIATK